MALPCCPYSHISVNVVPIYYVVLAPNVMDRARSLFFFFAKNIGTVLLLYSERRIIFQNGQEKFSNTSGIVKK